MFGLSPQILITAGIALTASLGSWKITSWYYNGEINEVLYEHAQAAQQAQERHRAKEREAVMQTDQAAKLQEVRVQKQKIHARVITKEVIRYVETNPSERFTINPEWVRVHETAARGGMSEDTATASESNDSARAVGDAAALEVITNNYDRYHECSNRLIGLQAWVAQVVAQ